MFGYVIERRDVVVTTDLGYKLDAVRLWVMENTYNAQETCLLVERGGVLPTIGERISWSNGKVYFGSNHLFLRKIGFAFSPPRKELCGMN